ncbi:galactose-binding domain-containing protein [Chloropicon primus]|uniref:Galactose-binding domain-containing protein n=1 Tax=Chloropicon primus TaxID=1764295 RepID=A0A5B8MDK4_9CHLO|nr:galactose-binding domain-containing protein [Chloropicon primus]UPQ96922.1 galactose-binding domain-containing protein [Chloropicon primus]|eukprot:QDZ17705.1 galactose-binding domain-containing protein [Chloropicon primus]
MTAEVKGQQDLVDLIEWNSVEVLNQSSGHPWVNAVKKGYRDDPGLYLESDCDEQLLIYLPFTQQVKLHSLLIQGPERETAPSAIKVFVNRSSVGFDEAESEVGTQTLELESDDVLEGKPVALKYVKFQKVQSVTVFISSNFDDEDVTKLSKLVLFGTPQFTTNMGEWEKACKT